MTFSTDTFNGDFTSYNDISSVGDTSPKVPQGIAELAQRNQWVVTYLPGKIPLNPRSGFRASVADPATWGSYAEAMTALAHDPKLTAGFVLSQNDPYVCIDLDTYKLNNPEFIERHKRIFHTLDSYSELSPNGGVHIWVKALLPEGGRRNSEQEFEIYPFSRYITVTNSVINDKPIKECQAAVDALYSSIPASKPAINPTANGVQVESDEEVWRKASEASNGGLFVQLWNGQWAQLGSYPSQSEADLAMINIIAFYTDSKEQVARMYYASPSFQNITDKAKKSRKLKPDYLFHERYGLITKAWDQKVNPDQFKKLIQSSDPTRKQQTSSAAPEFDTSWQHSTMPKPILLENSGSNRPTFPIEALTPLLKDAAIAIADRAQCPIDFAACSLLAVASLATQGHANVETPKKMTVPLSLHFLTVAKSGERKTTADNLAAEPVYKWQEQFSDEYAKKRKVFKHDNDIWNTRYSKVIGGKGSTEEIIAQIAELGAAPDAPLKPMRICGDPTIEGLVKLFLTGLPSLALFSSEGGQFIGGFGMNKDNRLKTAAWLSERWDANRPIDRVRGAKDEIDLLYGRRLALHLQVQPDVAAELYGMAQIRNQGWLQRLLVCYPNSLIGTRLQRDEQRSTALALEHYSATMLNILNWGEPTVQNKPQELNPYTLKFDSAATAEWIAYADEVEAFQRPRRRYSSITGFASKMVENAVRIAGVMTMVEHFDAYKSNPSGGLITRDFFSRARAIVDYFAQHLLLMVNDNDESSYIADALKLLDWLEKRDIHFVELRSIERFGPSCLRGGSTDAKSRRDSAIASLERRGWLELRPDNAIIDTFRLRQSTKVWKVNQYNGS